MDIYETGLDFFLDHNELYIREHLEGKVRNAGINLIGAIRSAKYGRAATLDLSRHNLSSQKLGIAPSQDIDILPHNDLGSLTSQDLKRLDIFIELMNSYGRNIVSFDLSENGELSNDDLHQLCSSELINLTTLDLSGCHGLTNLARVATFSKLIKLNLYNCGKLTNLSGIENLVNLTALGLPNYSNVTDFSGIEKLSNLTVLEIHSHNWLSNLTEEQLANLTHLDLFDLGGNLTNLKKIEKLESMSNLTTLHLSYYQELATLDGVDKLTNLTTMILSDCDKLTDISALEKCTSLIELIFSYCPGLRTAQGAEQIVKICTINPSIKLVINDSSLAALCNSLQENITHSRITQQITSASDIAEPVGGMAFNKEEQLHVYNIFTENNGRLTQDSHE